MHNSISILRKPVVVIHLVLDKTRIRSTIQDRPCQTCFIPAKQAEVTCGKWNIILAQCTICLISQWPHLNHCQGNFITVDDCFKQWMKFYFLYSRQLRTNRSWFDAYYRANMVGYGSPWTCSEECRQSQVSLKH